MFAAILPFSFICHLYGRFWQHCVVLNCLYCWLCNHKLSRTLLLLVCEEHTSLLWLYILRQLVCSMINKSPICSKCILGHAYLIKYNVCSLFYRVNCVSINPDDRNYIINQVNDCIFCECINLTLPFNNIMDNCEFIAAINHIDKPLSLNASNLTSHPFDIIDTDHTFPFVLLTGICIFTTTLISGSHRTIITMMNLHLQVIKLYKGVFIKVCPYIISMSEVCRRICLNLLHT